jgi:protein SCO1/2
MDLPMRILATVSLWLVSLALHAASDAKLIAGTFDPPREAPELGLQGSHGEKLNLRDYRGKIVILGFGFTSCPDVCPTNLAILAQARRKLGTLADQVQVVYVTVDPQTDTAERMRQYLAAFDPSFVGGTGDPAALAAVRKEYGVMASKTKHGSNDSYAHSSYLYLIDRTGKLRALMPYGQSADDFVHDVRVLLGER